MSIFDKHQKAIAIKTLQMNDVMIMVLGGMDKAEAIEYLKSKGYTDQQIINLINKGG